MDVQNDSIINIYCYDGSIEGLYSALKITCPLWNSNFDIVNEKDYQPAIFSKLIPVHTKPVDKINIESFLSNKCSAESRKNWRLMLCSGKKERNVLMTRYLAALVKYRFNSEKNVHDLRVFNVHQHVRNIFREIDRMLGLLRFEETVNGLYYSLCEPDHDIISFLAIHFKNRMPEQSWVIHDRKRCKAVIYQNRSIIAVSVPQARKPEISQNEIYFRSIWKTYFKTICIRERTNKKLQQSFIPNRYRKHLPELN